MASKPVVIFRYFGRFAHFLRAEASASAFSYPVPPRTVLLGLLGAVLGFEKDTVQSILKGTDFAVSNQSIRTHWHRAKFRKELPTALPVKIKQGMKGSDKPEKPTLIKQEWLVAPDYQITASLPAPHHHELVARLKTEAWHFSPCLGLSEMTARLEFVAEGEATQVPEAETVYCQSVCLQDNVRVDGQKLLEQNLKIQVLRMPQDVTEDRIFSHANYLLERDGRPIPLHTANIHKIESEQLDSHHVMFL